MNQVSLGRRGLLCGALCLATLVLAFAAPVAFAGQTGNITSINPDLAGTIGTPSLVGEGDVQVETSVSRTRDEYSRVWATPTLVRFGMRNYEIRLATQAYSRVRTYWAVNTGMSDVALGIKSVVPQNFHKDLSLAVLFQAGLPSGSQQIRNKGVRPEVQFVGTLQLPNRDVLGGIAGLRSDVDRYTNDRYATGVMGGNYTHTWNPAFTSTVEIAARSIRSAARGGKNLMYAVGAGWRAMPNTELNLTAGRGFTDNDTHTSYTIGISRRFHPPTPGQWGHKQDDKTEQTPSATTEDGK